MNIRPLVLTFGTALLLITMGAGCSSFGQLPNQNIPNPSTSSIGSVVCTQDAKQCPDGSYVSRIAPDCRFADCPAVSSPTPPNTCSGSSDTSCGPGYKCIQQCGPPVVRADEPPPGYICELNEIAAKPRMCPICLASNTNIATPIGSINVTQITVGTHVWSINENGEKIVATVIKVARTPVPKTHRVVHLVLTDKKEVWVSPNHPTTDGRTVGTLRPGDNYDGTRVAQTELVPYWDSATYDLLPDSSSGDYMANGIWLGSTLRQ